MDKFTISTLEEARDILHSYSPEDVACRASLDGNDALSSVSLGNYKRMMQSLEEIDCELVSEHTKISRFHTVLYNSCESMINEADKAHKERNFSRYADIIRAINMNVWVSKDIKPS